jgi:hypothetical protein
MSMPLFKAAACVCPDARRRRVSGACIATLMLAFPCANPIPSESRSKYALYMAVIDTYPEEWPANCLSRWYGVSRFEWSRREMPVVAASDHRLPPAADGPQDRQQGCCDKLAGLAVVLNGYGTKLECCMRFY